MMLKRLEEYHRIFNRWRNYDFLTTVFAMFGLCFSIIYYEHAVTEHKDPLDPKVYPDPLKLPRNTGTISNVCKSIIIITTVLALVCLYYR